MIMENFSTYGQNIYNTANDTVHSVEFLSRHRYNHTLDIESIFKASSDKDLADWFLRQQLEAIDFYNKTGIEAHINIDLRSFKYMYDNDLFNHEDKDACFTMEITQIHGLPDKKYIDYVKTCKKFKRVLCALDDYSLSNIVSKEIDAYKFDIIKLDRSLIIEIEYSGHVYKHIKDLIAANQNIEFIAEGIENIYQLRMLQDIGINLFQGFYFHRPEPLETLLENHRSNK